MALPTGIVYYFFSIYIFHKLVPTLYLHIRDNSLSHHFHKSSYILEQLKYSVKKKMFPKKKNCTRNCVTDILPVDCNIFTKITKSAIITVCIAYGYTHHHTTDVYATLLSHHALSHNVFVHTHASI